MRAMVVLLSAASPWSQRVMYASKILRRSSRLRAYWRKRPDARGLQREDPPPLLPGGLRGLRRGGDHPRRQPREVGLPLDDQLEGVRLLEDVVGEPDLEDRQLLVDGAEARLLRRGQERAPAHEVAVGLLEEPQLVGREVAVGAPVVDRLHPREELLVEEDVVGVLGEERRHLPRDGLDAVVGLGAADGEEDHLHALEQLPARVERLQRIGEGGGRSALRDGLHLAAVLRHALLEGRQVVVLLDLGERRRAEGRLPLGEEGVLGLRARGHGREDEGRVDGGAGDQELGDAHGRPPSRARTGQRHSSEFRPGAAVLAWIG